MAMISAFTTVDKTAHNYRKPQLSNLGLQRCPRSYANHLISEASFCHVQGTPSRDLWLSLEKAYAPHSTSREYTLKTQLLRIEMHSDETLDAYLNHAQEYVDALAAIGEPVKDKNLVMLAISGLREEYNSLKTTITTR
ncbi:nucleotide-binding alpha-beta plait domain-containing protein [Tanacetum coccineum]